MRGEARPGFRRLSRLRTLMGLVGPISTEALIPPEFSTNRGFMDAQYRRHLGLVLPRFHQSLNLIPLFPG
jgi:hypothetical protein